MKKVLFVCLGNICRSPAAHGVFEAMIAGKGLQDEIACDSCGTGDWHIGSLPDPRMRAAGTRRGYKFTHRARQFETADFDKFDLILTAEDEISRDVADYARSRADREKIMLLTNFCTGKFAGSEKVEDPYFSNTDAAFDAVVEKIENACEGLLKHLTAEK